MNQPGQPSDGQSCSNGRSHSQAQQSLDGQHHAAVIVGAGQAGLSMSYCLGQRGIGHLVLEAATLAHEWRDRRWDSFCLVTPNWQCLLPGYPYAGPDPHGFMLRDEIVTYLEGYARSFGPPVAEHTAATRLTQRPLGGFEIRTTRGTVTADQVVIATGPYQVPITPRMAQRLPDDIRQIHSAAYRSPAELPPGAVLVVGTGQSGSQIAEDLHLGGRTVHLATGSAPRVARFYRGRDVVDWLADMGYYARSIEAFGDADAVRFRANHYVTGRDGGRDIDLRAFARDGMRLHGRLAGISGTRVRFGDDLRQNLDHADAVSESIKDSIDGIPRRPADRGAPRGPLRPRLGTTRGTQRGRPAHRGRHHRGLGHGIRPGLPLDRGPGVRRPRLSDSPARGDQLRRAVLSRAALAAHLGLGPVLGGGRGRRLPGRPDLRGAPARDGAAPQPPG